MNSKVKYLLHLVVAAVFVTFWGCASSEQVSGDFQKSFKVQVKNPLNRTRENVMVLLQEEALQNLNSFNPQAFAVFDGDTEVPSQYNSRDAENRGIVLVLDQLAAGESRSLTIRYNTSGTIAKSYPKRTQAELSKKVGGRWENRKYIGGDFQKIDSLRVPDELTDHSYYLRYEGPGWESDKVGYRFYLDWRNAIDVFGKKTDEMVLQKAGLDGYDSYHKEQAWGMDILKVGKALGVGSLAMFDKGKAIRVEKTDSTYSKIAQNGPVYSSIVTDYYGWQVAGHKLNVQSQLSIHAGTRLTNHQIRVTGGQPKNLSTGLTNDKSAKLVTDKGEAGKSFGYMYTYGKQSLNTPPDNVGIAVLFRPQDFITFSSEDPLSHVVQLKPTNGKLQYYFLAAWELEPNGIKTEEQFRQYIQNTAEELANPVQVKISQ
ncbi:DUF4861 domain-containing protein [Rufibacter roseus]|uniref:DUF4861 domain-containing protein n=1 Tax=Rufibacter roseus TaxID=1567108 RepID=A0ABW2DQR6_9BACT|nr:DUF4861 domain-containing protein [Rufibacter roseus]